MTLARKILFSATAVVTGLLLIEAVLHAAWLIADYAAFRRGLPLAVEFSEEHHARYDHEIGWVNIPGSHVPDLYGPGAGVTINRQGFRGLGDLAVDRGDRFRLTCLGDSFTFGYGVDDRDTWPERLQRIEPRVQAVNMGQGGYSMGQAWMWFKRDGLALEPDAVVLAFIVDDFWRMVGDRMVNGYGKPTFSLTNGRIEVGNQPVPPKIDTGRPLASRAKTYGFLRERVAFVRTIAGLVGSAAPQGRDELLEQVSIGLAMIDDLSRILEAARVPFALVVMPELRELDDLSRQEDYRSLAAMLRQHAALRDVPFFDLLPVFLSVGPDRHQLFLREHWSQLFRGRKRTGRHGTWTPSCAATWWGAPAPRIAPVSERLAPFCSACLPRSRGVWNEGSMPPHARLRSRIEVSPHQPPRNIAGDSV
jgi:hypothetical protein